MFILLSASTHDRNSCPWSKYWHTMAAKWSNRCRNKLKQGLFSLPKRLRPQKALESNSSWLLVENWESCSQGTHSLARYSVSRSSGLTEATSTCPFGHQTSRSQNVSTKCQMLPRTQISFDFSNVLSLGLGTRKCNASENNSLPASFPSHVTCWYL